MNNYIKKSRLIIFFIVTLAFLFMLVVQFASHMTKKPELVKEVKRPPQRGSIYDRNGTLLAMQTTLYNITANKTILQSSDNYIEVLAPLLSMEKTELEDKINASLNFLYLKKKLTESEKNFIVSEIEKNKIKGVRVEPIYSRIYPEPELASTVIGFSGDDMRGLAGMEYSLDDILSPPDTPTEKSRPGYNVQLTLDVTVQHMLKKITEKTLKKTQAESALFLAVQAQSGEILAYVNEPTFNLTRFSESSDAQRFDKPAYYIYEPGSVFKIFSLASFLDMGITQNTDTYICDAHFPFVKPNSKKKLKPITCLRRHGTVTPRKIIEYSCNEGIAQIADIVDNKTFENKLRDFGFGKKTGVELPGETAGLLAPSSRWSRRSRHTIAMGQEVGVSSLQIVQAATAFANEGSLLKLTLISKILNENGKKVVYSHTPVKKQHVISPQVAQLLLSYMESRAQLYMGREINIKDISIGIKTGTAQMAKKDGSGYSKSDYVSSCIGLFPAKKPEFILYLAIFRPVGEAYGSKIAEPAIIEAASDMIDYYGLNRKAAPSVKHQGLISPFTCPRVVIGNTLPDFTGMSKKQLLPLLSEKRLSVSIKGEGYVASQKPAPGSAITEGMTIELILK